MVSRAPANERDSGRAPGRQGRRSGGQRKLLLRLALAGALAGVAGAGVVLFVLQDRGIAPRVLGPYLGLRSTGHNPIIEAVGATTKSTLIRLDRGDAQLAPVPPLALGAQPRAAATNSAGREVMVDSADGVRSAVRMAQPGDVITLMPGDYRFTGSIKAGLHAGLATAPITVRARAPGEVQIYFNAQEGFIVDKPWWRFENLTIQGVCTEHRYCEHAFHVVGAAHHFAAVNNRIADFNAHFKINGDQTASFPDHGLIESNTLFNTAVRRTRNPVTPVDLVAASDWVVRRNIISDFVKGEGDGVSYGAFFKGGGMRNQFDQNLIVCERLLRDAPGQRVGLSLGGGGTGKPFCRDRKCITEQEDGLITNNLIASCSDDGMYINSAARSKIVHNTLVDTGGISVRFAASSADVVGNLVDGAVRGRDGGVVRSSDNQTTATALLYAGWHPVRALFRDTNQFDFAWAGEAPVRGEGSSAPARDLCNAVRPAVARYGAFEHFAACLPR